MKNTLKSVLEFLIVSLLLMGCVNIKTVDQNTDSLPTNQALTENPTISNKTLIPISDDSVAALDNFKSINASFTQAIKTTTWIRQVSEKRTFNEQTQTYTDWGTFEEWFRFDVDGKYVEGYNWVSAPDGSIEQESCFINGRIYNVTSKSFNNGKIVSSIDFTGGFKDGLIKGKNRAQDRVDYQGVDAWKFFYELNDGALDFVNVIYFDTTTSLLLGKETWLKQSDGSTKLVSSMVIKNFIVDADPPLDHFQQISNQVPK